MYNPRPFHKRIALMLLAIFIPSLLPVNLLYASNNGPVAPEATSFEPVDATDMVNLITGDMGYVMPIMNVPSPEGGYPLVLSYHAGIAMDQEASWVGLGWNVNPGAINRSVNGVPDDWFQTNVSEIMYNAGGESKSFSGSISVGWGKGAYSVGLYASYTENKTFGGTTSYGFDGGAQASILKMTASVGSDGASIGFRSSYEQGQNSYSMSISQSFKNGSTGVGIGFSSGGLGQDDIETGTKRGEGGGAFSLGLNWNSQSGVGTGISVVGASMSMNRLSIGAMSAKSQSYSVSIPIYSVSIGLGYSKTRYWIYDRNYTKYSGALYAGDTYNLANDNFPVNVAFDSYNSIYRLKSDNQLEGDNLSYISYDNYSVSAQGLSGGFKPAIYEQGSLINNYVGSTGNGSSVLYKNGNNDSFTKNVNDSNNDIYFYFDNENTSYLRTSSSDWSSSNANTIYALNLSPQYKQLETSFVSSGETLNGYDNVKKRKRTGTYIEAFTNEELVGNPQLVIQPNGFNRNNAPSKGIGAYRITALDGKVYHYTLPVYQKQLFTKNTDLDSDFDLSYLELQQLEPYATHWLITAITGPDYVDTNNNNKVDEGDYGYWVDFDYGKWSDGFAWSTPIKYMEKAKVYEWGVKELYYLDKIKTRTHTAVFVKSERLDDQSYELKVGNSVNDMSWEASTSRSFIKDKNGVWYVKGAFQNNYMNIYSTITNYFSRGSYGKYIDIKKHKSLKLDKVLLFKNEVFNSLGVTKSLGNQTSSFTGTINFKDYLELFYTSGQLVGTATNQYNKSWGGEFYNNVYDKGDFTTLIEEKASESVRFDYAKTNLLAKYSRNSSASLNGKLTLEAVNFIGKENTQLIPPYKFSYNKNLNYDSSKEDNWGYYKDNADTWSLNKILTPLGSEINVVYESDDIDKEAVPGFRGFDSDLQYIFYEYNGNLRMLVQNEYLTNKIDFSKHFQIGTTFLDIWASYKHDYDDFWDGCKARKGSVDINSSSVQVVAVANDAVVLEFPFSCVYSDNGGFDWMSNKVIGLENHPGMIREPFSRGQWGEPPGCAGNPMDRLVLLYSLLGNKKDLLSNEKNSGGIRVKELYIKEDGIVKNKSKYFYNVPGFGENKTDSNYKSSGITSFVPQKYFKEIKYRSELPSPTVTYEYVTVKNYSEISSEVGEVNQYHFQVLNPDTGPYNSDLLVMYQTLEISKNQSQIVSNVNLNSEVYNLGLSKYTIYDKTANIGRLLESKKSNGEGQVLLSTQNQFKNFETYVVGQGISQESFNTYKRVYNDGNITYRLGVTSKIVYPSVLESTTSYTAGYTNTRYYDKYDFLTGEVLETRTETSDGKKFKGKIVPAYLKYPEMGSKVDNIDNRNMLSQTAVTYSYILDSGIWKETGVGITTWNNEWGYQDVGGNTSSPTNSSEKIWRKHKTYVWNGITDSEGIFQGYNSTTDDGFNWVVGVGTPQPSQWKQVSEVTLYNHYSMPVEAKDINGNKVATKMDVFDEKIQATGNAAYSEMYYSGVENFTGGGFWVGKEVRNTNGVRTDEKAHTGKFSIKATNSSEFGVYMQSSNGHRPGKYKLSVWVHKDNVAKAMVRATQYGTPTDFNGETYVAGDWVLKTHYFNIGTLDFYTYVTSADGSEVYFDDLMIRPINSSVTGYVYNEYDELTHVIGSNGLATRYEYDAAGRLIKTYMEIIDDPNNGVIGGFKLQSENKYHYKNL